MNQDRLNHFLMYAEKHEVAMSYTNVGELDYCSNQLCSFCVHDLISSNCFSHGLNADDVIYLKLNYPEYFV